MALENSPSPDNPNSENSFDDLLKIIFSDSYITFDDFRKLILNAVRRSCRTYARYSNKDDMEDIAQSIVLSLIKNDCRSLRSFESRSSLKTWLQRIANYVTFHFYCTQKDVISLEDLSSGEQAYTPNYDDKVLHDEITHKLTKGQRELLEFIRKGLKTNEIAERMRIEPDSVSRSKNRLREKIGKLLKSGDEG
jgi:RNA polymerase sigma factor (sigma-70 family)